MVQPCFLLCEEKGFALWEKTEAGARWEQRHKMQNLEAVPVHDSWFNLLLFFGHVSEHVGS